LRFLCNRPRHQREERRVGFPQSAVETRARALSVSDAPSPGSWVLLLMLLTLGLGLALTGQLVPAVARTAFATVRPLQGGIVAPETIRPAPHPVVVSRNSRFLFVLPKLEAKAAFSAVAPLQLAGNLPFSSRLSPGFASQDGWSGQIARAPPVNGIL
jgi:hypothetical protein